MPKTQNNPCDESRIGNLQMKAMDDLRIAIRKACSEANRAGLVNTDIARVAEQALREKGFMARVM